MLGDVWDSQPSQLLETNFCCLRHFNYSTLSYGLGIPESHDGPCVHGNPNIFLLPKEERGWPSVTLEALSGFSTCELEFTLQVTGHMLLPLYIHI